MFGVHKSRPAFGHAALAQLDNLFGYAMALSQNQAEAAKLVQETYNCAARAFGDRPRDIDLENRLYAIARSIWLQQMNLAAVGGSPATSDTEPDVLGPRLAQLNFRTSRLESDSVRSAFEQLPPSYREVIVLREFEGLSYCEIAGIVHCPAGTVWFRLDRARTRLRLMLGSRRVAARPPLREVTLHETV